MTLVLGKSGIGKTSLLNAGLFPGLREKGFLPIRIRLNYSDESTGLLEQTRNTITREIEKEGIRIMPKEGSGTAEPMKPGETLWEYFHRVRHEVLPVLVLDQFEEIFTLGKYHKDREKWIDELHWLIEKQIPTPLIERQKERSILTSPETMHPAARVIISLREDYLPHMTDLIERIPSINRVIFRVHHFNGKQARDIIGMPGGIPDKQVAENILNMLDPGVPETGEKIPEEEWEVEPSILSLICFQVFKQKISRSFTRKDRDKILMNFYQSNLRDFPFAVEEFIESKLLTEQGHRTPFYLEPNHEMRNYIEQLVDRRILRKVYYEEKEHIEIIHDVLAPIIREKWDESLKEKERQEREKKIRHRFIKILIITISAFAIIVVYAFIQKNRADREHKISLASSLVLEAYSVLEHDNTKAIRFAQAAYQLSVPHPSSRLIEVFYTAAYSSYKRPFYNLNMRHDSAVKAVAFSPDAKKIFTASSDGINKIWDQKGNLTVEFSYSKPGKDSKKDNKIPITSAVFSRDGASILTASAPGDTGFQLENMAGAQLWDLTGNLLKTYSHGIEVSSAIFSPDGSQILTASWDNTARLWDLNGKEVTKFIGHWGGVNSAIFSPDGGKILTASSDGTAMLWDLGGNLLIKLIGHTEPVRSAIFSPDGNKILTASEDGTAILWDLEGNVLQTYPHGDVVSTATFSPDGDKILTGSWDNTARVCNLNGEVISVLNKHVGDVNSVIFSPDGSKILTASSDGTAALWDPGRNTWVHFQHQEAVSSAIFSPDGTLILTASKDSTARLWPLQGDIVIDISHGELIHSAVFTADGSKILTVSSDGTVKLRDLAGNVMIYFLKEDELTSAVLSPDGGKIFTASKDGTAKLLDMEGNIKAEYPHLSGVTGAVFSPDGGKIFTASKDGTAKLLDLEGNIKAEYPHFGGVTGAIFSPDGGKILTTSKDTTAKLWNPGGNVLTNFKGHQKEVISAVFSPDGTKILTASWDHTAKLWDIHGNFIADFKHDEIVTGAVFSPDGSMILTSSEDGSAKLWNLEGASTTEFKHKNEERVNSAVFSPDGAKILTASNDNTAKLWDLEGNILADLNMHAGDVRFAIFSPDGSRILTASDDGTVKLWLTPEAVENWLQTAGIPQLSREEKRKLGIQD